jgi:hypothetical protein
MAAIRMLHPDHGATHAYNSVEVAENVKRGWRIEEVAKPVEAKPIEMKPAEVVEVIKPTVEFEAPRRGRPPKG